MTMTAIRAAFETRLLTLGWEDQTAWEGVKFVPTPSEPYQTANTVFAAPDDYSLDGGFMERGFFQVTLAYPVDGKGTGPQTERAQAIRDLFPRNLHLTNPSGQQVAKVMRTAEITRLGVQGDRDATAIRIRFSDR